MRHASILLVLFLFSVQVFSADRSRGCGLGTLAAPKKTLVSTTTAEIIDGFSMPTRPFAITSGTSGCAKHDLVKNEIRVEHFVAINMEVLKMEIARGHGERIAALSHMVGCPDSYLNVFAQNLKRNYADFVEVTNPHEMTDAVYQSLIKNNNLKVCL